MEINRYHIEVIEEEYGKYVLYEDIKHLLTKPDMTKEEAEALVKDLVEKTLKYGQELTLKNQDALTDSADKLVTALTGMSYELLIAKYGGSKGSVYRALKKESK